MSEMEKTTPNGIAEPTYEEEFLQREYTEKEVYSRYYKISSRSVEQLNMMDKLFSLIEYLGSVGSSRNINLYVDGDGAVHLKFKSCNEGESVFQDLDHEKIEKADCGYGVAKINLNSQDKIIIDLG